MLIIILPLTIMTMTIANNVALKVLYSYSDIDECSLDMNNCEHVCTNTNSSFICSCAAGYELSNDSRSCDGMKIYSVSFYSSRYYTESLSRDFF